MMNLTRRQFSSVCAASAASALGLTGINLNGWGLDDEKEKLPFKFKYLLGSSMYGETKLAGILPEVAKAGGTALDIWPRPHGNQREQLDEMGEEAFTELLKKHNVSLSCITQYKLGPFGLQDEMKLAKRLGCTTIVTGGKGPKGLKGPDLKAAVKKFVEQMKPHLAVAQETDVTIAIENHANNVIESPDSLKWLIEFCPSPNLGIAFAPYHLEQDSKKLAELIAALGNRISIFYAWQHGMGCMKKLPKEQELLQMPGRGGLDFRPLVGALEQIKFSGWTEIFMHPVPRGIPILESTEKVTAEINLARAYLEGLIDSKTKEANIKKAKVGVERLVAENKWYKLYETPVDRTSSDFRTEIIKPDAQLGIGITIDIAKVADSRGFKFGKVVSSETEIMRVQFFKVKPVGDPKQVFDVDAFMMLGKMNDQEKKREH